MQGVLRHAAWNALWRIGSRHIRISMIYLDDCLEAHVAAWRTLSRGRVHLPISAYLITELTTEHYSDIARIAAAHWAAPDAAKAPR